MTALVGAGAAANPEDPAPENATLEGDIGRATAAAAALLAAAEDVTLLAHVRPDADALGSALALGTALYKRGIRVQVSFGAPDHVPETLRLITRGAMRATSLILGASLVLVLVLLAVHGQRAANMWALLGPSFFGGIALALACVLSLPTLVLWAASVLVGPGFALGSGTSVDLTGSHLGPIPSFPTFAAVPDPGVFPSTILILGLLLPLAGVWAGSVTTRVRVGAAAGAAAGLGLGILIGMSGGGVGPGRMAEAGPPPVTPLVVAVLVLAASGAIGSLLAHYRGRRDSRVPSAFGGLGVRGGDESASPDRRDD